MNTAIWWVRRDLRLSDQPALQAAFRTGMPIIPLYILDPVLVKNSAEKRRIFLMDGLRILDRDLRQRGSRLIIRTGDVLDVFLALAHEMDVTAIFAERDYSPYSRKRDELIARYFPLHLIGGSTVFPPDGVVKPDGAPYTVFTPYSKTWKSLPVSVPLPELPAVFSPVPETIISAPLPEEYPLPGFPAGEMEAQRRLVEFTAHRIDTYHQERDRMDLAGTSVLSPYFHFGMISARQAAAAARQAEAQAPNEEARRGAQTWLNELIWREFYTGILFHYPYVLRHAFNPALEFIPWVEGGLEWEAWQHGQTGYPVVDACQRQMLETGWMHNRGRMISASFLVKDLLISWKEGERFFMHHLVDGNTAANNGGWQWTAGTGTDAAPYFRIFNPTLQGKKFDPNGAFVRRWVPELASVPDAFIHEPWKMTASEQIKAHCRIGVDYPAPIIDHAAARTRTLAAYQQSKNHYLASGREHDS